jgi:hypothetical protein
MNEANEKIINDLIEKNTVKLSKKYGRRDNAFDVDKTEAEIYKRVKAAIVANNWLNISARDAQVMREIALSYYEKSGFSMDAAVKEAVKYHKERKGIR